jgi:hypothetical protein
MAREILRQYHPDLKMTGDLSDSPYRGWVSLCLMMVSQENRESEDPPLKVNGYPAAAVVSVIPHKQRADKRADAEILIDQRQWDDLTEPQQRSLLDHEI